MAAVRMQTRDQAGVMEPHQQDELDGLRGDIVDWLVHFLSLRRSSEDAAQRLVLSAVKRQVPLFGIGPVTLAEAAAAQHILHHGPFSRDSNAAHLDEPEPSLGFCPPSSAASSVCPLVGVWASSHGKYKVTVDANGALIYHEELGNGQTISGTLCIDSSGDWWEADVKLRQDSPPGSASERFLGKFRIGLETGATDVESAEAVPVRAVSQIMLSGCGRWKDQEVVTASRVVPQIFKGVACTTPPVPKVSSPPPAPVRKPQSLECSMGAVAPPMQSLSSASTTHPTPTQPPGTFQHALPIRHVLPTPPSHPPGAHQRQSLAFVSTAQVSQQPAVKAAPRELVGTLSHASPGVSFGSVPPPPPSSPPPRVAAISQLVPCVGSQTASSEQSGRPVAARSHDIWHRSAPLRLQQDPDRHLLPPVEDSKDAWPMPATSPLKCWEAVLGDDRRLGLGGRQVKSAADPWPKSDADPWASEDADPWAAGRKLHKMGPTNSDTCPYPSSTSHFSTSSKVAGSSASVGFYDQGVDRSSMDRVPSVQRRRAGSPAHRMILHHMGVGRNIDGPASEVIPAADKTLPHRPAACSILAAPPPPPSTPPPLKARNPAPPPSLPSMTSLPVATIDEPLHATRAPEEGPVRATKETILAYLRENPNKQQALRRFVSLEKSGVEVEIREADFEAAIRELEAEQAEQTAVSPRAYRAPEDTPEPADLAHEPSVTSSSSSHSRPAVWRAAEWWKSSCEWKGGAGSWRWQDASSWSNTGGVWQSEVSKRLTSYQ